MVSSPGPLRPRQKEKEHATSVYGASDVGQRRTAQRGGLERPNGGNRLPCYKLGLKFGRDDILKRFLKSELTGFYFAVLKEGEVAAGDPIRLLHRDEHQVKVADITRLYRQDKHNLDLLRRVVAVDSLPEGCEGTS